MMKLEFGFCFLFSVIAYTYVFFPLILAVIRSVYKKHIVLRKDFEPPSISIVIVVRNGENYIEDKIKNCLSIDYPDERREVLIVSDGSDDKTSELVEPFVVSTSIRFFEMGAHKGKNTAINFVLDHCHGKIIIFTDVSAILQEQAGKSITRWFGDPSVGGVCGRKLFTTATAALAQPQSTYLSYEDFIRKCESEVSSIASNEGFFYAVRRKLVRTIPKGVTDDLYTAMQVVQQNYRFLFDPEACAELPVRAKQPYEELLRRRRIVCCSLTGISRMKALLNPLNYPFYSWILFSHKVLRRVVPIILLLLLVVNIFLVLKGTLFVLLFLGQLAGYIFFLLVHFQLIKPARFPGHLRRVGMIWYYFCLGNVGTFLGVFDLLRGVKYEKWDPVITDDKTT